METINWSPDQIDEAVDWIKNGEVVAFPTETVYGLGADATNEAAVQKIYSAKGRPSDNPLIIHVSSLSQVSEFVTHIPQKARLVMSRLWPGPCTIVLNKKGPLAPSVTGGLETVGIRMPDHPVALALIEKAGVPLAAPSANSSGKPSPTTAEHVFNDLGGRIKGIIDGGATGVGLESTVLDLTDPEKPTILRPGGVSFEELTDILGTVYVDEHLKDKSQSPKSPGMKYRHYSPDKPVYILPEGRKHALEIIEQLKNEGQAIGLMISEQSVESLDQEKAIIFSLGDKNKPSEAASRLYNGLRVLDQSSATVILAESYESSGIGRAYMNRLEKAAEWIDESV